MSPKAEVYWWKLSFVTPDPTNTGMVTLLDTSLSSFKFAGTLVEEPVMMTPSLRKNSAALAVSAMLTSLVIEWALCFFLDVS